MVKRQKQTPEETPERARTVASLPVLPWETDADGAVTWLGPQWHSYTDRPLEALRGAAWPDLLPPDDRGRAAQVWDTARQTSAPYQIEHRLRAASGAYAWFLTRAVLVPASAASGAARWVGASTDVEMLKRPPAESESGQTALLETLLRTAPVGIAFFDTSLRYLQVNDVLAAINGLRVEEHVGRFIGDVLSDLAPAVEPLLRAVLGTGESLLNQEVSGVVPRQPGRVRYRLVSAYPVRRPGSPVVEAVGTFVVDVTDQVRARREQAALARVGAVLSAAQPLSETLTLVAESAAELFDTPYASVFRLADGGGVFALFARTAGVDAGATPPEARDRGHSLAGRALASGRPEAVEDTRLTPGLSFPEILVRAYGVTRSAPPRAALSAPIINNGVSLGAVEVSFDSPRTFDDDDRRRLVLLAHQAGVAVANAESYTRERMARAAAERDARRAQVVAEVAQALSLPVSLDAVLEAAVETLASSFPDGGSGIWLHDPGAQVLRMGTTHGYSAAGTRAMMELRLGDGTAVTEAFRRRDVVIYGMDDPAMPERTRALIESSERQAAGVAATPLIVSGQVIGAMSLFSRGQSLDVSWAETLRTVGALAAAAVERSRLLERERGIASRLQGALLPALQDELLLAATGLGVAHRYRPGTEGMTVGGDFYDVWSLPEEGPEAGVGERPQRLAVLLGDISGKGLEAAVQTAAIRHAVLAYAHEDPTPVLVVRRVNDLAVALNLLPGGFATMFFATVDAATGRVDYCSAGHESLLLRAGDGRTTLLDATAPALGLVTGGAVEAWQVVIEEGGALILYTDGITEARTPGTRLLLGLGGLTRLLTEVHDDLGPDAGASSVAAGLLARVEAYAGGRLEDDAALLVISRPHSASLATAVATSSRL